MWELYDAIAIDLSTSFQGPIIQAGPLVCVFMTSKFFGASKGKRSWGCSILVQEVQAVCFWGSLYHHELLRKIVIPCSSMRIDISYAYAVQSLAVFQPSFLSFFLSDAKAFPAGGASWHQGGNDAFE